MNCVESITADITRVVGAPVAIDIDRGVIRLKAGHGYIVIGRVDNYDIYNSAGRLIKWWYEWYTMRAFIRSVLELPDDGMEIGTSGLKITARVGGAVHCYENGAAYHSYDKPRWLDAMPSEYPAELFTPACELIVALGPEDIPADTFGVYGANIYKFAHDRGLKFARDDLRAELERYTAAEKKRADVRAAVAQILAREHSLVFGAITVRLPRDMLLNLVMAELPTFTAPADDPSAIVPFA